MTDRFDEIRRDLQRIDFLLWIILIVVLALICKEMDL